MKVKKVIAELNAEVYILKYRNNVEIYPACSLCTIEDVTKYCKKHNLILVGVKGLD